MELYIYPTSRKKLFTNREHLRSEIKISLNQLEKGRGRHLCFCGLRKIGKTELVFGLLESVAIEKKTFAVVFIDEFQEILQLNNFRQIKNIIALFRANLQKQNRTRYIIAGSATRILENIICDAASPIFGHFTLRHIEPFTKEDTFEFTDKLIKRLTDMDKYMVYKLTGGHPYYIYSLCNRMEIMYERYGRMEEMVQKTNYQS